MKVLRYILAIILPPIAVLVCHQPKKMPLNLILTFICGWVPGIIHACMVVHMTNHWEKEMEVIEARKRAKFI
ncbi:MAG TPA: YqaE/Pmp3 family membrane protein [Patescibacteria group bacterium]|nr:YqaE/Pmp3 family membrane protein [Patescibacteria group bacterium]